MIAPGHAVAGLNAGCVFNTGARFVKTRCERLCKNPKSTDWRDWPYVSGDGAVDAPDGYCRIPGRIDDVINVSGHRLGTKELENACLTAPDVSVDGA